MSSPLTQRQLERELIDLLEARTGLRPRVAMLLGSGHASITNQLKDKVAIGGDDVPGMPLPSPIHAGILEGVPVAVADLPLQAFDGLSFAELAHPVRVLKALGASLLIITGAAASLRRQIEPGAIAVIEDHLNFSNLTPLTGPNDDQLGSRFPDMSEPYAEKWVKLAREVAINAGVPCPRGIFGAIPGPSMPTRAEYRFLRNAGADLVGTSLVHEAIAGVHAGFEVLALVGVTQQVSDGQSSKVSIEAMIDAADLAAPRIATLLVGLMAAARSHT